MKNGGETGFGVLPWGHRHPLSGGTATPRAMPTWPRFCAVKMGVPLSLTVCTAIAWVLHCQVLSGATTAFYSGLVNLCWSEGCHRHGHHGQRRAMSDAPLLLSREWVFRDVGWVVTTTLV
jgi:hypothetical protein